MERCEAVQSLAPHRGHPRGGARVAWSAPLLRGCNATSPGAGFDLGLPLAAVKLAAVARRPRPVTARKELEVPAGSDVVPAGTSQQRPVHATPGEAPEHPAVCSLPFPLSPAYITLNDLSADYTLRMPGGIVSTAPSARFSSSLDKNQPASVRPQSTTAAESPSLRGLSCKRGSSPCVRV